MSSLPRACTCSLHRRRFLRIAAGAAAVASALPLTAIAQEEAAPVETEEVKTLLLICNEPKVWAQADTYLKGRKLTDKLQPVEVLGGAIGLVADEYKAARPAFWDKLMAATAFQQTNRVIALNHRGCSAAKTAYGMGKTQDRLIETEINRHALMEFRKQMAERSASIDVWIGLIGFDGKVEMFG